jgi:hypothetical protein
MKRMLINLVAAIAALTVVPMTACGGDDHDDTDDDSPYATETQADIRTRTGDDVVDNAARLVKSGRRIFRYDTFGSEDFFTSLGLHDAIAGRRFGGHGAGLDPQRALELGLKIDVDALPSAIVEQLEAGAIDLSNPATTLALLELDAVIGITGFSNESGGLQGVGIQCALCHSTVDDSFGPGIGKRLDGYPNQDLDVGKIVALAPNLEPYERLLHVEEEDVREVLKSWGPGRYDPFLVLDGKAFRPDGQTAAVLIPPAMRLGGVNLHTYTGMGSMSYWNAFVANTQMMGKGTFYDPRLDNEVQFPIAAKAGLGHIDSDVDRITSKLPALQLYQLSLPIPKPKAGSYNIDAAKRGAEIFNGKAECNRCHVPPLYTEPGFNMHTPQEIGIDAFHSNRAMRNGYRTAPLRALSTHTKRGFYHDGRFESLYDVVNHYNEHFRLGLDNREQKDLVEFLKSL